MYLSMSNFFLKFLSAKTFLVGAPWHYFLDYGPGEASFHGKCTQSNTEHKQMKSSRLDSTSSYVCKLLLALIPVKVV